MRPPSVVPLKRNAQPSFASEAIQHLPDNPLLAIVSIFNTARIWLKRFKGDALTLCFACAHPDTPWHAKALAVFAVVYVVSPIDLIPDFIPVLGYLDDAILAPLLIRAAVRLLPAHVLAASRLRAEQWQASLTSKLGGGMGVIGNLWRYWRSR